MASIVMSQDQEEHYNKLQTISNCHSTMVDTTVTGGGKTIFPLVFAHRNNIKKIIVFCPGNLHQRHWERHRDLYNSPIIKIITYDQLRGSIVVENEGDKILLSHGLLYRSYGDSFEPTELYKYYVEEGGLLLVLDEFHLAKNEDCGKTKAVKTLTKYLAIRNMINPLPLSRSFIYFSSMTPFDDPDHVINFGHLSGIIRSDSLIDKETNNPTGILELQQYCSHFEPSKTSLICNNLIRVDNVKEIAYRLISDIFLRMVSSFVKDCHKNFTSKQSIYYSYFDIDKMGIELMKKALGMIRIKSRSQVKNDNQDKNKGIHDVILKQQMDAINKFSLQGANIPVIPSINQTVNKNQFTDDELNTEFRKITNNNTNDLNSRTGIMYGTMTTQSIKTYYITINFIQHIFMNVRNSKVVVFLNYKESVDIITRLLSHFNPVAITGDVSCNESVRNSIVERFQEPNLNVRLLLIMSQIGSDGIELDDTHGNFPRISIGLPDFYNSRYFQSPGRTLRRYTKSNSLFFFIMVNSDECLEESLDKSINNKSKVMIETLRNNDIIAPMNFEKIYNPDRLDLNVLLENAGKIQQNNTTNQVQNRPVVQIKTCSIVKSFI